MGDLDFDPAKMAQGRAAIEAAHGEIKQLLAQGQADVDALQGGWKSAGSVSFGTAHTTWQNKASVINTALTHMHEKLGGAHRVLSGTDSGVSDAFGKFAG